MFLSSKYKVISLNLIGGLSIFFVLVVLRLPVWVNADMLLTADEGIMAYQILDLYNGNSYFTYYDVTNYFGVTNGLAAFPFFWVLGIGALAFKLPATLFYALYILSTYWLVKKIQPRAALMVILLMIFSSPAIWWITTINYGVGLTCFLGNLIFLSFFKVKETAGSNALYTFLLGFFVGFAIYTFTYSIVYIGSIIALFVLTNDYWENIRLKFSMKTVTSWFMGQKGAMRKFVSVLDGVILFYIFTVLFSYVFGGFGIDIAEYSILQSNELHKPLVQLLFLIFFRMCLFRQDIRGKLNPIKSLIRSMDPSIKRSVVFGFFGFIIGILPRLLSIFLGETTRGGQGFDVDFMPSNMIKHFWQLSTYNFPDLLGLRMPLVKLLDSDINFFYFLNIFLIGIIVFLISSAIFYFLKPRWKEVKDIFRLKALVFNPSQAFLVLTIFICIAVIISQGPPATRYLFPLHGIISIFTAIYLDKVLRKSKTFFALALTAWCTFSTIGIYQSYVADGIVRDFSIVEKQNRYSKVLGFCKEHKILHAYSGYGLSAIGTFLSKGDVQIAEYTKDVWGGRIKERLAKEDDFAIVIDRNESHLKTYQKYLDENLHSYSKNIVKGENSTNDVYYIFSNFQGEVGAIDRLRSLIVS